MTAPTTQQQPSQPTDQQLGSAVAAVLVTAGTVVAAASVLAPLFLRVGVSKAAVSLALDIVMNFPPAQTGFYGPATQQMSQLNLIRRGQFVVNSSRRFSADQRRVLSGELSPGDLQDTMDRERRYYAQHMQAIWQREMAAARVDSASMLYGRLLGWNAVADSHVTPDCLAADGKNFYADKMPRIGYPGTVHATCRCWPGAPFRGAAMVGGRTRIGQLGYTFGRQHVHA